MSLFVTLSVTVSSALMLRIAFFIVMLSVIMQNVVVLSVIMLNVIVLNVLMLSPVNETQEVRSSTGFKLRQFISSLNLNLIFMIEFTFFG
jgi:hypothetical protein